MYKKLKCPTRGSEKRIKSGFNNKKQRYLRKECGCNYAVDSTAIQSISDEKQYSCIWKEMVPNESKEYLKLAMFLSQTG